MGWIELGLVEVGYERRKGMGWGYPELSSAATESTGPEYQMLNYLGTYRLQAKDTMEVRGMDMWICVGIDFGNMKK